MEVTVVAHDVGGVGGMEHVLAELVCGLVAAGDRVTVVARTVDVPDVSLSFHRVRGPSRPFVFAYPWFLFAGTIAVHRHRRGTVESTGAIVLNYVDFVSIHFCHRAFRRDLDASTASRSTFLFRTHARVARALARFGERVCLRPSRLGQVVAVSPGVAAEVREFYPRLAGKVTVIPNGVDRNRFSPASPASRLAARTRFGLPVSGLFALFVGGDWGRTGLAFAIDALADADAWQLIVAGHGDEGAYRQIAEAAGVLSRVSFLGVVRDTPELYRAADAFLLPTAYETFSLVAYEAAASGLPLIATAANGIEDVLVDGVTGFRIVRDSRQIASRLRRLSDAPATAAQLGAAARRLTAEYTWEAMVARHRELYETAIRAVA
jgi:UDP-glucose:(heptosyl)LPS alpha-1,3-glucosyltransferase